MKTKATNANGKETINNARKPDPDVTVIRNDVLERIRASFERPENVLMVYIALKELESEQQSRSFSVTRRVITSKFGVSDNDIFGALNTLKVMGLLEIGKALQSGGPSTYTLRD
jgi:hypothetical protein